MTASLSSVAVVRTRLSTLLTRCTVDKMLTSMENAAIQSKNKLKSAINRLDPSSSTAVSENHSDRACAFVVIFNMLHYLTVPPVTFL